MKRKWANGSNVPNGPTHDPWEISSTLPECSQSEKEFPDRTLEPSVPLAISEQSHDFMARPMVAVQHKVEKHGRVRTTHRRGNRVVAAPLYSTPRNRDPTVNKRNLKKIRDDLYREQARVEDEKKREATRKMRNEHQSRMTHYEIEQGWKEVEHKYGFALPPEFQSPALDGVERQAYTDRCKALDFYVMRIEQVNTFVDRRYVPRPVSAAAPARRPPPPPVVMEDDDPDWKDDIDERKGNARGYKGRKKGEDDDDERDPHDGAPGGPRFDEEIQIRKRQRHEPDEGRDPDDADPAESHGRPFQGRLPNASAWRKKTDVPHRDDEPSPYQQWDVGDAVASSKPWFDLKQDDASVEATLRLSGFMEQPGLGPGAPVETVPGVVYVHNFRSRMYALVPPVLWPLLGLVPRSELERDVHVQYVDARDETTATDADYQRTGLVQLSQRRSIRDWLTQLQPLLEEATREAMAWNKRKTNRNAPYILALRLVWRAPQYQFQENCLYPFVEITTCLPQVVPQLREILQAGLAIPWPKDAQTRVLAGTFPVAIAALIDQYAPRGPAEEPPTLSFSVYECDIRYAEQRFPADTELAGDTWITLPRDTFSIRPARERRTLGLVADRRNPRCEVPAVAEFDTSFRTMQVHSQRAKLERKPNRMPFNYKRLLERTRGITWSPRSPLHPDQPPTGPPLRPAYPALGPNLEVLDPHHPLAPLPHQPFVPPAKWDPAAPPTSIVSTGPPLPTWDELMRLMAPPPAPPPKPPEEKKAPEGPNWKRIANYPLLVWDIECAPKYNPRLPPERQIKRFPNPLLDDPVVAVSLLLGRTGQATVPQNANECQAIVVATAKSAAFENMPGCRIVYVPTERELLLYVAWVMRKVMPGYILSYNGDRFDWPYILDRSIRLCEPLIQYPTAIPEPLIIKESSRGTKGSGDFIQSDVFAKGTNNVDLLRVMRRLQTERFTSYSLNNMAQHFLKQTKADVHHTDIPRLIRGTPLQVRRLLIYNIWDALLVLRLFFKQKYHLNIPFMARSTGIQAQQLFEMGPGTSSLASFLIECAPDGLLRPLRRRRNVSTKFKGATVIRPKTGFYLRPIPVMDFASLYPSIMIAFNLCMSTNLTHEEIVRMRIPKDQYITVYSGPNGEPTYWTKPSLRQGILPIQLQSFLAARAAAKKAMGDATSLSEKDVYDCIQAVMKIRANSVYGLTKEMMEKISATVTYIGRQFILYMKRVVEEHMVPANGFGPAQGFPTQPQVAYGDTDSIMCDFGDVTVPRAFEIGKIIAALAKFAFKEYGHIVKLEFEKVYYPFMLPKKKRYGGGQFTEADFEMAGTLTKLDKKGSEAVRSDSCKMQKEVMLDVYDMLLLGRLNPTSTAYAMMRRIHFYQRLRERYKPHRKKPPPWLDLTSATFVDPFATHWSDPKSPFYTAPLPLVAPAFKEMTPEARKKWIAENRQKNLDALVPLTPKLLATRVKVATELIRMRSEQLMRGEVDLSKLVLSKQWRKKNYPGLNIAIEVATKMRRRDPGAAPHMGDRVPFLIQLMPKGTRVAHCAEEPMHMLLNKLPVDLEHYRTKQLQRPLCGLMLPVFKTLYPGRPEFQAELYCDEEDDEDEEDKDLAAPHEWLPDDPRLALLQSLRMSTSPTLSSPSTLSSAPSLSTPPRGPLMPSSLSPGSQMDMDMKDSTPVASMSPHAFWHHHVHRLVPPALKPLLNWLARPTEACILFHDPAKIPVADMRALATAIGFPLPSSTGPRTHLRGYVPWESVADTPLEPGRGPRLTVAPTGAPVPAAWTKARCIHLTEMPPLAYQCFVVERTRANGNTSRDAFVIQTLTCALVAPVVSLAVLFAEQSLSNPRDIPLVHVDVASIQRHPTGTHQVPCTHASLFHTPWNALAACAMEAPRRATVMDRFAGEASRITDIEYAPHTLLGTTYRSCPRTTNRVQRLVKSTSAHLASCYTMERFLPRPSDSLPHASASSSSSSSFSSSSSSSSSSSFSSSSPSSSSGSSSLPKACKPSDGRMRSVQVEALRPQTQHIELTDEEKKKLRTELNKRAKNAIEAARRLLFGGSQHSESKRSTSLDVEHTTATRLMLRHGQAAPTLEIPPSEVTPGNTHSAANESDNKAEVLNTTVVKKPKGVGTRSRRFVPQHKEMEIVALPSAPTYDRLTKLKLCVACKSVLDEEAAWYGVMCGTCANQDMKENEVVIHHADCCIGKASTCPCQLQRYKTFQETLAKDAIDRHEARWRGCYKCAGSVEDALRCQNADCEFIYEREALSNQVEVLSRPLEPFVGADATSGLFDHWYRDMDSCVLWVQGRWLDRMVQWVNTLGLTHGHDLFSSCEAAMEAILTGKSKAKKALVVTDSRVPTDYTRSLWGDWDAHWKACRSRNVAVPLHMLSDGHVWPHIYPIDFEPFWVYEMRTVVVDDQWVLQLPLCDGYLSPLVTKRIHDALHSSSLVLLPADAKGEADQRLGAMSDVQREQAAAVEHDLSSGTLPFHKALQASLKLETFYLRLHYSKCTQSRVMSLRLWSKAFEGGTRPLRLPTLGRDLVHALAPVLPVTDLAHLVATYVGEDRDICKSDTFLASPLLVRMCKLLNVDRFDAVTLLDGAPKGEVVDRQLDRDVDLESYDELSKLRMVCFTFLAKE